MIPGFMQLEYAYFYFYYAGIFAFFVFIMPFMRELINKEWAKDRLESQIEAYFTNGIEYYYL